jgi:hypothetical protein
VDAVRGDLREVNFARLILGKQWAKTRGQNFLKKNILEIHKSPSYLAAPRILAVLVEGLGFWIFTLLSNGDKKTRMVNKKSKAAAKKRQGQTATPTPGTSTTKVPVNMSNGVSPR